MAQVKIQNFSSYWWSEQPKVHLIPVSALRASISSNFWNYDDGFHDFGYLPHPIPEHFRVFLSDVPLYIDSSTY